MGQDLHKVKMAVKNYRKPIVNTEELIVKSCKGHYKVSSWKSWNEEYFDEILFLRDKICEQKL